MLDGRMDRAAVDRGLRQGLDGNTGELAGRRLQDTLRKCLEYPHHRRMLIEESGISPEVDAERG